MDVRVTWGCVVWQLDYEPPVVRGAGGPGLGHHVPRGEDELVLGRGRGRVLLLLVDVHVAQTVLIVTVPWSLQTFTPD